MAVGAIAMSVSTIVVAANAQLLRGLRLRRATSWRPSMRTATALGSGRGLADRPRVDRTRIGEGAVWRCFVLEHGQTWL